MVIGGYDGESEKTKTHLSGANLAHNGNELSLLYCQIQILERWFRRRIAPLESAIADSYGNIIIF